MKRIAGTDQFEPGVIYELRCRLGDSWHPFYVGETTNADVRKKQHTSAGKSDTRWVYQFFRETLIANNIEWNLFPVHEYGNEGPTDLEHEHIMCLLYDGVRLKNMKKGSDVWMQNQIEIATDMRKRGIRSYRKYREALDQDAQQRVADAQQARWLAQHQRSQLIQDIEQKRIEINAKEEEIEKIKHERNAKKAADLAKLRSQQQATWQAQRAREAEDADRERAQHRKETLAHQAATAAEADRQAALAAARAQAFEKEWPEHQARLDAREQLKAELTQSKRDNARYMRDLERKYK